MARPKHIELITLLEISKVLASTSPIGRRLYSAMRILGDYLDMHRGTVTLRDLTTGELRIAAAYGLTRQEIKRGKYRIGEGIVGKVVKSGSPTVIPLVKDEPLFLDKTRSRSDILKKDDISFLCVPIKDKDEVLGVLSVDRLFGVRITFEEDLRVMKMVAQLIAQTVRLENLISAERQEKESLRLELKAKYRLGNLIGSSKAMQEVFRTVLKVAKSRATVLLRGESGTGKELIAKAIYSHSERVNKPFIKVNCAAIPENLLESEFFGHEKGAFTGAVTAKKGKFEAADGGAIFLDEIGELAPQLQSKLLRVLQEREFERVGGTKTTSVDVRLIAATNRDLEAGVANGSFRGDLYYRLNVVPIFLPALRERLEDIPILIEHFLKHFNKENDRSVSLDAKTLGILTKYHWPGNVRELENTIERTVVLAEKDIISPSELPMHMRSTQATVPSGLKGSVETLERERIVKTLESNGWIYARAARSLGLTERQLVYRVKKYVITKK